MPAPVQSVFGRVGAVVAVLNDYAASLINNDSTVTGATAKAALETLAAAITALTSVYAPIRLTVTTVNASRALLSSDNNKLLEVDAAGAVVLTVDGGVNAAGDVVCIAHKGAGALSVAQGGGGMSLISEGNLLNSKGTGAGLAIWFATSTRAYLIGNRA